MIRIVSILSLALLAAAPAAAGEWIDDKGRATSMQHANSKPLSLRPNGHSVSDGIAAFEALCINTDFDALRAGFVAEQMDWGFVYREEIMPFSDPVDIGGYNSADAALRISSGIFFNKKPQCNLTFLPGPEAELAEIEAGLTDLLGAEPVNKEKQFKKNGKPQKNWAPEWIVTTATGDEVTIFAKPSVGFDDGYHLSILKN